MRDCGREPLDTLGPSLGVIRVEFVDCQTRESREASH